MIASLIAYALSLLFAVLTAAAFRLALFDKKVDPIGVTASIFVFGSVSWGFAYLGGLS